MVVYSDDKNVCIQALDVGGFIWANTYLVTCLATEEAVLIDASGKPDRLLGQLTNRKIKYVLMTHSHNDHTGALAAVKSQLKIPVAGHSADSPKYPVVLDIELHNGDTLVCGKNEIRVYHTPGHTRGSLCFLIGRHLFSGDTLFPGGPGYTATPDDFNEIVRSINNRLFPLPDETVVYPGHGETTVLGKEKDAYKAFAARPHLSRLCGDVLWLKS